MSKQWTMDLEAHTPSFGQRLPEGDYLVEVMNNESEKVDKGNRFKITYKVIDGPKVGGEYVGGEQGGIISDFLYVVDSSFKGEDVFRRISLDNWYFLLSATKAPKKGDFKGIVNSLTGRRLVIKVVHSTKKKTDGTTATYSNVNAYKPAEAWGNAAATTNGEQEPEADLGDIDLGDIG